MNGRHLHIQPHGGRHGLGNGVRDVVKFQIEEDAGTGRANALHDVRPGGNEQFLADLERADGGRDLFRKFQGQFRGGHIQRNDDGISHFFNHKWTRINSDLIPDCKWKPPAQLDG
jgi:hypothetical protein